MQQLLDEFTLNVCLLVLEREIKRNEEELDKAANVDRKIVAGAAQFTAYLRGAREEIAKAIIFDPTIPV